MYDISDYEQQVYDDIEYLSRKNTNQLSCSQKYELLLEILLIGIDSPSSSEKEYVCNLAKTIVTNNEFIDLKNIFIKQKALLANDSVSKKKKMVFIENHIETFRGHCKSFFRKNNISFRYLPLLQERVCCETLLTTFLSKHNIPRNPLFFNMINKLSKDWLENIHLETPYRRTSYFRAFLYSCYEKHYGSVEYDDIDSKVMGELLAVSRAHFSFIDLFVQTPLKLKKIHEQCYFEVIQEKIEDKHYSSEFYYYLDSQEKKHIKNWKIRSLYPRFLDATKLDYGFFKNLKNDDRLLNLKLLLEYTNLSQYLT